jgi:hypothetical protein
MKMELPSAKAVVHATQELSIVVATKDDSQLLEKQVALENALNLFADELATAVGKEIQRLMG